MPNFQHVLIPLVPMAYFSRKAFLWAVTFYALAVAASFLLHRAPALTFAHDWEPSDGDVINQVMRLIRGLPLDSTGEPETFTALPSPLLSDRRTR